MGSILKAEIILIPWDPESPEHIERLYQQRIACGWNKDQVETWRDQQREGKKSIQWIALSDSDPTRDVKTAQHLAKWPLEAARISDTAIAFGAKPRMPSKDATFHPIGHISLDSTDPTHPDAYDISTFYVSTAIQGGGIGSAAMDVVEAMATSEPLCAKTLKLYTAANENFVGGSERWVAMGRERPAFSKQDWYQRRGYVVYDLKEKMWREVDSQGKVYWTSAVFMRKDIQ